MFEDVAGFILIVVEEKFSWFVGLWFWWFNGWNPIVVGDSRLEVGETMTQDAPKCGLG